jgi:hypothetical protein
MKRLLCLAALLTLVGLLLADCGGSGNEVTMAATQ